MGFVAVCLDFQINVYFAAQYSCVEHIHADDACLVQLKCDICCYLHLFKDTVLKASGADRGLLPRVARSIGILTILQTLLCRYAPMNMRQVQSVTDDIA